MKTVGNVIAPQLLAGLESRDGEGSFAPSEFRAQAMPRALEKIRRVLLALLELPFPDGFSAPDGPETENVAL